LLEKFALYHDKDFIGVLGVDIEGDHFSFETSPGYGGPVPYFLRFPDSVLSMSEKIKEWVLERAPEPNYEFIDALMDRAGMTEYDPYLFFKYNQGQFLNDDFRVEPLE
jgi:hypothetical protein